MGNILRKLDERSIRIQQNRESKDLYRAVAERYIKTTQEMGFEHELAHRKPRPHRRRVKFKNEDILKTENIPNLIWEAVDPVEGFRVELDPTVPDERFDKFGPETLLSIAQSLRTKKPKNYDHTCYEAIIAMTRYLNADRRVRWGNMVAEDDTFVGDTITDETLFE